MFSVLLIHDLIFFFRLLYSLHLVVIYLPTYLFNHILSNVFLSSTQQNIVVFSHKIRKQEVCSGLGIAVRYLDEIHLFDRRLDIHLNVVISIEKQLVIHKNPLRVTVHLLHERIVISHMGIF